MDNYEDGSESIDTSDYSYLAPTTLIPLLCNINKYNLKKIHTHQNTEKYVKEILNMKSTLTRTPYMVLPHNEKDRQNKELSHKMALRINEDYGGFYVLRHIISELTNNIYNHTSFEDGYANQGYTYAQEYPNLKMLDICVMDDGLSIPGRFKKSGIEFTDECHAIEKAISNLSTVSKNPHERGNGLWTTVKLVVEGNKGSVLIVSDKGCLHINGIEDYKYKVLHNKNKFKGTLISVRLNKNKVQHVYDLMETFTGNPYKYNKNEGGS
ncbi:hypothetical protein MBFIL_15290 [Methanobrevibacter filiformis]|uniref:Histidine kinase-, DNA gyrase B-, and HSP90-like ATPase n=2 Tax=Methanobrevibacter filiformis TaxID=55758 RepID=A0A166C464_9EURY|nr:hypothetical protein MBFIL_15290 [Methanobrevibacter filiformis]